MFRIFLGGVWIEPSNPKGYYPKMGTEDGVLCVKSCLHNAIAKLLGFEEEDTFLNKMVLEMSTLAQKLSVDQTPNATVRSQIKELGTDGFNRRIGTGTC